jgi:hypothetical protein
MGNAQSVELSATRLSSSREETEIALVELVRVRFQDLGLGTDVFRRAADRALLRLAGVEIPELKDAPRRRRLNDLVLRRLPHLLPVLPESLLETVGEIAHLQQVKGPAAAATSRREAPPQLAVQLLDGTTQFYFRFLTLTLGKMLQVVRDHYLDLGAFPEELFACLSAFCIPPPAGRGAGQSSSGGGADANAQEIMAGDPNSQAMLDIRLRSTLIEAFSELSRSSAGQEAAAADVAAARGTYKALKIRTARMNELENLIDRLLNTTTGLSAADQARPVRMVYVGQCKFPTRPEDRFKEDTDRINGILHRLLQGTKEREFCFPFLLLLLSCQSSHGLSLFIHPFSRLKMQSMTCG